jgi:hypothetical protein
VDDASDKWLAELRRLNGLNRRPPARDESSDRDGVLSNELAQSERKGPHRLGRILRADPLAIRITNRRARAGLKPMRFSR